MNLFIHGLELKKYTNSGNEQNELIKLRTFIKILLPL